MSADVRLRVVMSLTATLGVFFSEPSLTLFLANSAFAIVVLAWPVLVGRWNLWMWMGGLWLGFGVARQPDFDDHVYLFIAWFVAVALVANRGREFSELQRHARVLIGVVFLAASLWKLAFGDFLDGSTLGLVIALDSRFEPFAAFGGMSEAQLVAAREGVRSVIEGSLSQFTLPTSEYSIASITAVSVAVWAVETAVGVSHVVESRLASRVRPWTLLVFGLITYGVAPVVGFAAILSLLGAVASGLERRWTAAFAVMAMVPVIRVLGWVVL